MRLTLEKCERIRAIKAADPSLTKAALSIRFGVSLGGLAYVLDGRVPKKQPGRIAGVRNKRPGRPRTAYWCGEPALSGADGSMCREHSDEWARDFPSAERTAAIVDNALATCWQIITSRFPLFAETPPLVPAHFGGFRPMRLPCLRVATDVMMATEPTRHGAWFGQRMHQRSGRL